MSSTFPANLQQYFEQEGRSPTITFHAYANKEPQNRAIVIPITADMKTVSDGYAHREPFAAKEVANGGIYALITEGTAFSNTATSQTVMPFRTYLTTESTNAGARLQRFLL